MNFHRFIALFVFSVSCISVSNAMHDNGEELKKIKPGLEQRHTKKIKFNRRKKQTEAKVKKFVGQVLRESDSNISWGNNDRPESPSLEDQYVFPVSGQLDQGSLSFDDYHDYNVCG